jgi:hypothetical protein
LRKESAAAGFSCERVRVGLVPAAVPARLVLLIRRQGRIMARKPNYRFERFERERVRAAKKAARAQAKADKKAKSVEGSTDDGAPREAAPAPDDDASPSD